MERELFAGCDVSKGTFHYCLRSRQEVLLQGEVKNTVEGIRCWLRELDKRFGLARVLFCMEHTGIYVAILCRELRKREALVCLENSLDIKHSLGMQRGKSDKIDASRIAEYAMRFGDRLHEWSPPRKALEELDNLCGMRRRLLKAKKILSDQNKEVERFYEKAMQKKLIEGTRNALEGIDKDLEQMKRQIVELLNQDASLKRLKTLVTSVPGVGLITCCELLIRTREFTTFANAKKLACTAGVVPFEHTSGSSIRGKSRVSPKAHHQLKTLLHMCALSATSREGEIRTYYMRKIAQGKNKMLVLNAVRNKLVHRIFAVVRDNSMYQENYQYTLA